MKKLFTYLFFIGLVPFISSCKKNDLCDPAPKFNIDLFIQNVEGSLSNVSGYQFTVNQNGNLYYAKGWGVSVHAVDPGGPISMTAGTRMNVASVSKFIGAIAMMQVLEKHNIGVDQPIQGYLPGSWKSLVHADHFNFGSPYLITFRNLLRMETGLAFTGSPWSPGIMATSQEMLDALMLPAIPGRVGGYQNGNFTLIRILIGEIEYNLNETTPSYDALCTDKYFDYIRQHIFDKLNLNPPLSVAEVNSHYLGNFTRAYQFPFNENFRDASNLLGWAPSNDPTTNGGSGGLVLSSLDLAKVLAFFRHDQTGLIISGNQRALILNSELGLFNSTSGSQGRYQCKNGTRGPEDGPNSRALRSTIMIFPNGVEAVLLSNCDITTLRTILSTAFDNAFVSPC